MYIRCVGLVGPGEPVGTEQFADPGDTLVQPGDVSLGGRREHRGEYRGGSVQLAELHGRGGGVHVCERVVVLW
jgi:hypothetical protein